MIGTGLVIRAVPGLAIGLWPGCPVPAMLALVAVTATVAPVFSAATSGLLPEVLRRRTSTCWPARSSA